MFQVFTADRRGWELGGISFFYYERLHSHRASRIVALKRLTCIILTIIKPQQFCSEFTNDMLIQSTLRLVGAILKSY